MDAQYIEGLEVFLDASGEDTADIDGILSQFPLKAPALLEFLITKESARVLDVGSGNGAKAIYLAQQLLKSGIRARVDSIEPKEGQRDKLAEHYSGANEQFRGDAFGGSLADYTPPLPYDLVLVIHSLYEFPRNADGTIQTLDRLNDVIAADGLGIIIIEHPDGDFQKMKRELYPLFGKTAPVSQTFVVETLKKAGLRTSVGDRIEFRFDVTALIMLSDTEIGRHFSFLFSDALSQEIPADAQLAMIGQWVRAHARTENDQTFLETPDTVIWAAR